MAIPNLPPEYTQYVASKGGPGLTSLDDKIEYMIILLDRMLKRAGGTVVLGDGVDPVVQNPPFIRSQVKLVDAAGTAVRLPDIRVPNGFFVAIKALRSNWDSVYLSSNKADAEGRTIAYDLGPGEAVDLRVSTLENIWLDAVRSGEGITWIVEQEATY